MPGEEQGESGAEAKAPPSPRGDKKGNSDSTKKKNSRDTTGKQSLRSKVGLSQLSAEHTNHKLADLHRALGTPGLSHAAILQAKDTGAQLFSDMGPQDRKEKLEGLLTKLDEQLKEEMANKNSIDEQLRQLAQNPEMQGLHKSDIQALHHKANKSVDKQDAMRLLMLQYCAGLQSSLASPSGQPGAEDQPEKLKHLDRVDEDAESGAVKSNQSLPIKIIRKSASEGKSETKEEIDELSISGEKPRNARQAQKGKSPEAESREHRSSSMGGFVRRASSSVREKVSMLRKDFTRKSVRRSEEERSLIGQGDRSSGDDDRTIVQGEILQDSWVSGGLGVNEGRQRWWSTRSNSDSAVAEVCGEDKNGSDVDSEAGDGLGLDDFEKTLRRSSEGDQTLTMIDPNTPKAMSVHNGSTDPNGAYLLDVSSAGRDIRRRSDVEILVHGVDGQSLPAVELEDFSNLWPDTETGRTSRSYSDSGLEMMKKCTRKPEDVPYHTGSLPKNLESLDESDDLDDSDFFIIDSSDEGVGHVSSGED